MSLLEIALFSIVGSLGIGYLAFLTLLSLNSRAYTQTGLPSHFPTVSLVIPTYNEATIIERKLNDVLKIVYPREKLQVIVVDSASTDDTRRIVGEFVAEHQGALRVVLVEQAARMGKTEALNEALKHVQSDVFALTDADVTFPADSLAKLVANLGDPGVGAVSAVEIPVGEGTRAQGIEADYRRIYTAIRMAEASTDTPLMCESELSVYRRDLLDPLRSGGMCDDLELTVEVRSKGYRSKYDLYSTFYEREAGTFTSKLKHKFRRGMANQHALLRNAKVLFNRAFGRYGTVVYPFEFFVHVVSPLLLAAFVGLFVTALVLSPFSALVSLVESFALAMPCLLTVRRLMRKYSTEALSRLKGSGSWAFAALAFLAFQGVLLISLLRLAVWGPQVKWEQIDDTRIPSMNLSKPTVGHIDDSELVPKPARTSWNRG